MNFDANRITNDIHKKVTALVKQKSNSFEEAVSFPIITATCESTKDQKSEKFRASLRFEKFLSLQFTLYLKYLSVRFPHFVRLYSCPRFDACESLFV